MASVSWPSAAAAPDGTTIGFNSSGLLTVLQSPKLVLPSGISIQQDSSNYLGIFNSSGTEVETVDGAGHHVFANTSSATNAVNIEVITNNTNTTLTSGASYISNYSPPGATILNISASVLNLSSTGPSAPINLSTPGTDIVTGGGFLLGGSANLPFTIGNFGAFTNKSAFSAVNLSASYSTTSTTAVSTGLGTAGVPVSVFTVNLPLVVSFEGYGYNNTLGDGVTLSLYVSTAGVPAQGSAPPSTDTLLTSITTTQEGLASNPYSMPITYVYTPTTANENYYFYVTINAVTGGTATIATPSSIVARGW